MMAISWYMMGILSVYIKKNDDDDSDNNMLMMMIYDQHGYIYNYIYICMQ